LRNYYRDCNVSAAETIDYYNLKQHKPWFDEECSKLLYQRMQAKLQWLQDPSQIIRDHLWNIRHENSGNFKKKRGNI
jgi:hypothetical protein